MDSDKNDKKKDVKLINVEIEISTTLTPEEEAKRKKEIRWDNFFDGCMLLCVVSFMALVISISKDFPTGAKFSLVALFFSGTATLVSLIRNVNRGYTSRRTKK